ncbi:MAG: PilN domain-containing protein [Gammaproteobacteria bacterium]|nr:PilN domain-containing protein [Gammaproteobacteria bacterium]
MQQINLYKFFTHPVRSSISFNVLIALYSILIVFLFVLYEYGAIQKNYEEKDYQTISAKLKESQQKLDAANKKINNPVVLKELKSKCETRFSVYMEALAKAAPAGVWLTNISITNKGNLVDLRGHSMLAAQVNEFIANLKQQKIFTKYTFELQELNEFSGAEGTSNYFNFTLVSKAAV